MGKLLRAAAAHKELLILGILIVGYIVIFSTLSILRHDSFASNYDLANMDQTIWNTLHGHFFEMTSGNENVSRLATHADFILILLTPFYLIWDSVRTLLVLQSAFLGLGAAAVFLLAKRVLNNKVLAIILAAVYLANPAMQWANIYDFHGVTLAIPFLLFTFYFAYTKNWKWFWIFFFLSLITKEEISLFLAAMGFFMAIFLGSRKSGLGAFVIGISWFILMIFLVIPHFSPSGQNWAFNQWYSAIKADLDQHNYIALVNVVRSGATFPRSLEYYILLLKPFGFLPIIGLPWLLMALPELLINVASINPAQQTIYFQYSSGIIPALVIATIFAFKYLQLGLENLFLLFRVSKSYYVKVFVYVLALILLVIAGRSDYHLGPLPVSPSCWCLTYQVDKDDRQFNEVLGKIPENASVAASGEVRPHISHRENSYSLPTIPNSVDYIAIIDQDRIVGSYRPHEFELSLIQKLSGNRNYRLSFHQGHFYLFEKAGLK